MDYKEYTELLDSLKNAAKLVKDCSEQLKIAADVAFYAHTRLIEMIAEEYEKASERSEKNG